MRSATGSVPTVRPRPSVTHGRFEAIGCKDVGAPHAILEDAACVSPALRPHLLAASVHYLHGTQTPDNPVIRQVQEALQHKG